MSGAGYDGGGGEVSAPLAAPSILDRLLDGEPDLSVDTPRTRQKQVRDALESLRRDLEAVLNTRRCATTPPAGLPRLRRSLLTYGVGDFIGANMVTREQRQVFAATLEEAIRESEPRFRNLAVSVLDPRDAGERVLRLRIEAMVVLEDSAVPVLFASSINPATLRFSVAEASYV
jgi:type VI secretion system protein ImpF